MLAALMASQIADSIKAVPALVRAGIPIILDMIRALQPVQVTTLYFLLKEERPEKRIEPADLFYIIYAMKPSKAQFRYVFLQQKTGKNKAPFQKERGLASYAIAKYSAL